jgi:phosphoglycolate phosphatase-like HAD superfamily hydrolase
VVTGKSRITADFTLEELGVLDCFGAVYGGDDVERQKPDPQALLAVMADLGVTQEDSGVMIGDSAADVQAGRAAGLATIGVLWGNPDHDELRRSEPDLLCATIAELRKALGLHFE